jgi:hypothetical protein
MNSGTPEQPVFTTDRVDDPTAKSSKRIAASAVLRVAKRRGVADTNLAPARGGVKRRCNANPGPAR